MSVRDIAATIRNVYTPKYILLNFASAAVYYLIYTYLLAIQQRGVALILLPIYLVYSLVITSSIALTISIYSYYNTRNNNAKTNASAAGTATVVLAGIIGGCNCTAPILFSLTALGLSAVQVVAVINFVSANSPLLFGVMIAINLFAVLYYLNKLSTPSCKIKK